MIYLDNAATTQVSNSVLNAMLPYFRQDYGNAGSIHSMGAKCAKAVNEAREKCALPINADADNIIFTAGGSEANNLAIRGLAEHLKSTGKMHIITTQVEHPSVLNTMEYMETQGFHVEYLPVGNDGTLDINKLRVAFKENTGLVSVMTVNNETGNLYDVHQIGAECAQRGVLFHTDCVQGYGNVEIDVKNDNIDFLSVSGHKFHSPKGIGFLYVKNKELLSPVIYGGGQEHNLRSGTENVPGIVGMGVAAESAYRELTEWNWKQKATNKRETFLRELNASVDGVWVNGIPHEGSKTINLYIQGIDGETLLLMLNSRGVYVSAGSACSAHSAVPSHVLTAMGLTDLEARSSIRVSFSRYTTDKKLIEAAHIIADCVKTLRDV